MPSTGQLIEATVKWGPGKIFEGQFGPSQNITLTLSDGSEHKVYFKPGLEPHASLKKGQRVKVIMSENPKTGKPAFTIISDSPPLPGSQPGTPKSFQLSDDQKREIAEYIVQQSKMLRFCIEQASKECGDTCPSEESIRSLGVSLYIAAQRKFGF